MDERIIALRKEGWSCRAIAENVGVSKQKVVNVCKAHGLTKANGYVAKAEHYAYNPASAGTHGPEPKKPRELWPYIPEHNLTKRVAV